MTLLPLCLAAGALLLPACTSRFDWREARLADDEVRMLLPARPATLTRRIHLRDQPVEMTMIGADADGLAFTVAIAGGDDPASVQQRVADMHDQMLRNIAASPSSTPQAAGVIAVVDGDGRTTGRREARVIDVRGTGSHAAIRMQARFFVARGRAAQAVVLGRAFDEDAARQFFDSLRIVEP